MPTTFVYLNTITWEPTWTLARQRVQNIARELAGMGHPGIFVNGRSISVPRVTQSAALGGRELAQAVRHYIQSALQEPPVLPNLRVISPPGVPGTPDIRKVFLRELLDLLRDQRPVLYYSTPFHWVDELDVVPDFIPVVYDCADEHTAFSYATSLDVANENRLVARADLVICSAVRLMLNKSQLNDRVYYVPNAVDLHHFEGDPPPPADIANLPRPIVGFVGGISEWVDHKLTMQVAQTYPEASVVLIGPVNDRLPEGFEEVPNIHLLGPRPYHRLRDYLCNFDVGLIPFKVNELTLSVSPLKLFEYLAAGLPTVTTSLPEIFPYRESAFIARSREEFVALVGRALTAPPQREALRQIVANETWRVRAESILRVLNERDRFNFRAYLMHQVLTLRRLYEELVSLEPNSVTMIELCRHCWICGDHEGAFAWAQRAIGPGYAGEEALLFSALGHIAAGRQADAVACVTRYVDHCREDNPVVAHDLSRLCACRTASDFQGDILRAALLRRLRLYQEAIVTLSNLPPDPAVTLQRAHLAFALGQFDLAVDLYAQLDNPWASAEFCSNMAEFYRKLGRQEDCEGALAALAQLPGLAGYAEKRLADLYLNAAMSRGSSANREKRQEHHRAMTITLPQAACDERDVAHLRVGIAVDYLRMGGLETHVHALITGLLERGHHVTLVCSDISDEMAQQLSLLDVRITKDFPRDVDVLHLHPFATIARGCAFARQHRIPVVTTYHGVYHHHIDVAAEAGPVIAVSQAIADYLRGFADVEPRVIENGIDLTVFSADGRDLSTGLVLWLGRMDEPARQVLVPRLVAAARVEGLRLLVAGSPIPPGCEGMPEFLGAIWDVPQWLRRADIVLGTGRGIREAMACGCAAVVCNHHGFGGLVTPDNVEALRRANFSGLGESLPDVGMVIALCKQLLANPARLSQIQQWSAEYAHENFGLEQMVDATVATYRDAIRRKRERPTM